MVILQFNKLIRNKWIWGVFAVAISAAFCFDFLVTGDRGAEGSLGDAGTLDGEQVDAKLFQTLQSDARGIGRNQDFTKKQHEINEAAWEAYAALKVAGDNGLAVPASQVQETIRRDPGFQQDKVFNFRLYQLALRENSLTPEQYEDFISRRLTVSRLGEVMVNSADWVDPMELDQAVSDFTDSNTVRVATFTQKPEDAAKVTVDDAALEKWYNAHTNSLALPERIKIRMVKFDATDTNVLARMAVTENDMKDRFDATIDKYTSTDTNGVEVVKKYDELTDAEKKSIENELRQIAAVEYYTTNMNQRIYQPGATLDAIAAAEGAAVTVSDWFSTHGGYQEGFMKYPSQICSGAKNFSEVVAELDPENADLKYGVVASDKAVWLVEQAEVSPAHVPTFAEAKDAIRPRALRDAKADAFKAQVEAVIAKGKDAVLASGNVSTNYTFAICDLKAGDIPDGQVVAKAAAPLAKGELSPFMLVHTGKAIVVYCEDRVPGDSAKALLLSGQMRDQLANPAERQLADAWLKWNLKRMNFKPGEMNSVEVIEDVAE